MSPPKIALCYLHPGHVPHGFMDSVCRVMTDERYRIQRVAKRSGADITWARNACVAWFLESSDADYLWWVDADMVFDAYVPGALVVADQPIVAAFAVGQDDDGEAFPAAQVVGGDGVLRRATFEDFASAEGPVPVAGVGMACTMIRREVLAALGVGTLHPFAEQMHDGGIATEGDVTFCLRAADAGHRTYVHAGLPVGHVRDHVIWP